MNKNQYHRRRDNNDFDWVVQHPTTHNLNYQYDNPAQPNTATHIGDYTYTYDANGNTIFRKDDQNNNLRQMVYDEENRMLALADNGKSNHYIYDAQGKRVIKANGNGQVVFVNGKPNGGTGTVGNFTVYASPYVVVQNSKYTKHYYIGSQRIVAKIGNPNSLPVYDTTDYAGLDSVNYGKLIGNQKDLILQLFNDLGLQGEVLPAGKSGKIPFGQIKKYLNNHNVGNNNNTDSAHYEKNQYYYHPDHLGSTSYLTDASGEVYQHLEYLPFGETLIEEHQNSGINPYLYNGKELDAETGLYYYGARYYDPVIARWTAVDPMAEKYNSLSPYNYVANNPIIFIDYNGMSYGDYYDSNGKWLYNDGVDDNKAYVVTKQEKTSYSLSWKGLEMKTEMVDVPLLLNVDNDVLVGFAAALHAESGGNKEETYAIGNVCMNFLNAGGSSQLQTLEDIAMYDNNFMQGATQAGYRDFLNLSNDDKNSRFAMGAAINAVGFSQDIAGFSDYSNGANTWDGIDLISTSWDNGHRNYTWSTSSKSMLLDYKTRFNGGVNVSNFTYKSSGYQISTTKIIGKTLFTNLTTGRGEKKQSDIRFK